ncbi:MAG: LptF/LptG family permease, partial [Verrucomicrobiaceae bacterium]
MKFLQPILNLLNPCWRWVRCSPFAPVVIWLGALVTIMLCQHAGYHESFIPQLPSNFLDTPKGWEAPPNGDYLILYLLSYMRLFVLVGGVIYHVYILRAYPNAEKMLRPTWVAAAYLTVWALASSFYDNWESTRNGVTGEEISGPAFIIQMILMVCLLLSPPFIVQYFIRCKILERYVLRTFLQPLLFCFVSFCTLWIVMDLLDHLSDFRENDVGALDVLNFYIKLIPFIYVTVSPIALLLATLYSLGKMSRANELISMLGVGRSLGQVLRPIMIIGIYASFLGMVADYHWAPAAAGSKNKLLEDVKETVKQDVLAKGLVYRNTEGRRTWFIGIVPSDLRK